MDELAVATLGGAVIGGAVVLVLGFLRESWEHRRWLRESRLRLYAEFIDRAVPAEEAVEALWLAVKWAPNATATAESLLGKAVIVEERFGDLKAVFQRLQLVASPGLRREAEAITFDADEFRWWIVHGSHGGTIAFQDIPWGLVLSLEQIEEFVTSVRLELGSESRAYRIRSRVQLHVNHYRLRLRRWWQRKVARRVDDGDPRAADTLPAERDT